jgi:hypothetical protein
MFQTTFLTVCVGGNTFSPSRHSVVEVTTRQSAASNQNYVISGFFYKGLKYQDACRWSFCCSLLIMLCNSFWFISSFKHITYILWSFQIFFFQVTFLWLCKGSASGVLATDRRFIWSSRFNWSKFTRFPSYFSFFIIFFDILIKYWPEMAKKRDPATCGRMWRNARRPCSTCASFYG